MIWKHRQWKSKTHCVISMTKVYTEVVYFSAIALPRAKVVSAPMMHQCTNDVETHFSHEMSHSVGYQTQLTSAHLSGTDKSLSLQTRYISNLRYTAVGQKKSLMFFLWHFPSLSTHKNVHNIKGWKRWVGYSFKIKNWF